MCVHASVSVSECECVHVGALCARVMALCPGLSAALPPSPGALSPSSLVSLSVLSGFFFLWVLFSQLQICFLFMAGKDEGL